MYLVIHRLPYGEVRISPFSDYVEATNFFNALRYVIKEQLGDILVLIKEYKENEVYIAESKYGEESVYLKEAPDGLTIICRGYYD